MPDDPRFDNDADNADDAHDREPLRPGDEIPASVAFMEMMRQAAFRSRRKKYPWADATFTLQTPTDMPDAPMSGAEPEPDAGTDEEEEAAEAEPPHEAPPGIKVIRPGYYNALEAQRIQRIKRRNTRRRRRAVGVLGGFVRSILIVGIAASLMATIFTWWTPSGFIATDVRQGLSVAMATSVATAIPTSLPTPNWLRRIGIVSGHRGPEGDPGAVCDDGLTEAEINFEVAQLVVRNLRGRGYTVDLLDEFDPRLDGYQAAALVSIHANSCQDYGEVVSGFLIAAPAARITARGNDELLVECVARHYASSTRLQRREGVTEDMTDYHTFREIHSLTPAAIIELGFMLADRDLLTQRPDALARGITDGILCYLEPAAAPTLAPTAPPTAVPEASPTAV